MKEAIGKRSKGTSVPLTFVIFAAAALIFFASLQLYSFKGYYYNYTLSGMSAEVNASVNTTTAYGGMSGVKITLKR